MNSISKAFTHQNLTLHLIHGPDRVDGGRFIPLAEALKTGSVRVHETGEVGRLEVENLSDSHDLFIQAGDVVKGGRQDRTLGVDLVLPTRSGRFPIPSFCVERGRWHQRAGEDARQFSSSDSHLAGRKLRMAAKLGRNQAEIWSLINESQETLACRLGEEIFDRISPSSYALTREHRALQMRRDGFREKFTGILADKPDAIGCLFEINGVLSSADVYGSHVLFEKLWDKLLEAAVIEAIEESGRPAQHPGIDDSEEIRSWLQSPRTGQLLRQESIPPRVEFITRRSKRSVRFDTRDTVLDQLLHRSLIMG